MVPYDPESPAHPTLRVVARLPIHVGPDKRVLCLARSRRGEHLVLRTPEACRDSPGTAHGPFQTIRLPRLQCVNALNIYDMGCEDGIGVSALGPWPGLCARLTERMHVALARVAGLSVPCAVDGGTARMLVRAPWMRVRAMLTEGDGAGEPYVFAETVG